MIDIDEQVNILINQCLSANVNYFGISYDNIDHLFRTNHIKCQWVTNSLMAKNVFNEERVRGFDVDIFNSTRTPEGYQFWSGLSKKS